MLVVCAGTATDVGKTWVGSHVLEHLRRLGMTVAARKAAQSFDPADRLPTDADLLGAASGEDPTVVCRPERWYPVPMAPPMAAAALGLPQFTLRDLDAELQWPDPPPALQWVETVGGVRSPIADDADTVDVCDLLHPDLVLLVADAGLGTVNAVRTNAAPLGAHRVWVHLNRYDASIDLHRRNRAWLLDRCGFEVETDVEQIAERICAGSGRERHPT